METPTFTCLPCNFTTSLKANLVRHQNTAKHIKICECQEVVTKTVIEVVNTENKEPINSVNNQLLDKMEELTKKNESLEEIIKRMTNTIETLVIAINDLASQKQTPPPTVEEEKNESINVVIPVSIPLEPLQPVAYEAPKKKKNKISLINNDMSMNEMSLELEKMKIEKEAELEKMRMEIELAKIKAKSQEKTPIDIIDENRYGCPPKMIRIRGNLNMKGTMWEFETFPVEEKEYKKLTPEVEDVHKQKELYVHLISDTIIKELSRLEENQRPIAFYKGQLYGRMYDAEKEKYLWTMISISDIVEMFDLNIRKKFFEYGKTNNYSKEEQSQVSCIVNQTFLDKDYNKIQKNIMSYIMIK